MNIGVNGLVKGIPIYSFLQMLESEEKTCILRVKRKNDTGLLYIKDGALIGAETDTFDGIAAAHLILVWQDTVIEILGFNDQIKRQINKPLISIIKEAFRPKNKSEKELAKTMMAGAHQLPLKHFPTLGKRIPLKIGGQVKLEFPHLDFLLESIVIGMLQDQYLITSTPQSFPEPKKIVGTDQRIIIKYIQDGRLWMFKARLLDKLHSPYQMLFFEYPRVLHYHELREAKRSSIFIPCTFHLPSEPELYGVLIDMSTTGGLCQLKGKPETSLPPIAINTKIWLHCLLPGIKEEQKIHGTVKNVKTIHSETRVGIQFENLQPYMTEIISTYLSQ